MSNAVGPAELSESRLSALGAQCENADADGAQLLRQLLTPSRTSRRVRFCTAIGGYAEHQPTSCTAPIFMSTRPKIRRFSHDRWSLEIDAASRIDREACIAVESAKTPADFVEACAELMRILKPCMPNEILRKLSRTPVRGFRKTVGHWQFASPSTPRIAIFALLISAGTAGDT
jgi:hypothetical protein